MFLKYRLSSLQSEAKASNPELVKIAKQILGHPRTRHVHRAGAKVWRDVGQRETRASHAFTTFYNTKLFSKQMFCNLVLSIQTVSRIQLDGSSKRRLSSWHSLVSVTSLKRARVPAFCPLVLDRHMTDYIILYNRLLCFCQGSALLEEGQTLYVRSPTCGVANRLESGRSI